MERQMATHREERTAKNQQPLHVAQLSDALLNVKTVQKITGLSRSTLHAKVKGGTFPEPIKLSARCVRWTSISIQQWIQALATSAQ
jgi:prophage regulatory protein